MPRLAPFDTVRFKQTMVDVYYPINRGQLDQRGIKMVEGGGGLGYYFKLNKFQKKFFFGQFSNLFIN